MPFAGYKDFDDCVRKNSDKKDPKAYCAVIERNVKEGTTPNHQVTELLNVSEAEFHKDEATGKMTGTVVIIKAGRAQNPRNYRSSALRKAVKEGIYNGMRMYVNHSDKPPIKRSLTEMVAAVESTHYDPKIDGIIGDVEFFNPQFFDFAQAAKKYLGVSASHLIRVSHVKEASTNKIIEDVQEIVGAHSVDWVVYPSAGGEVLSFAKESEGADQVEWNEITVDQLETNAPQLIAQLREKLAKEGEDDDPPPKSKGDVKPITADDIKKMVQEQVQAIQADFEEKATKRTDSLKKTRDLISKSGLPARTQTRLIDQFSDVLDFDEKIVKESIDGAVAELKEAGVGPKITGMGVTGGETGDSKPVISVREGVEEFFGAKKAAPPKKES